MLAHNGVTHPALDTVATLLQDAGVEARAADATIAAHKPMDDAVAIVRLGRALYPGEPMATDRARDLTRALFSDPRHYDPGAAGQGRSSPRSPSPMLSSGSFAIRASRPT